MSRLRLLAGPSLASGSESYADHARRLGAATLGGRTLIEALGRSGLTGRGGSSFPVATKWKAVAAASKGRAVVIANGAEGEPQSHKDRLLMRTRPHLILDGAFLAARTLQASQVVVYVGEEHGTSWAAMGRALAERPEADHHPPTPARARRGLGPDPGAERRDARACRVDCALWRRMVSLGRAARSCGDDPHHHCGRGQDTRDPRGRSRHHGRGGRGHGGRSLRAGGSDVDRWLFRGVGPGRERLGAPS